MRTKDHGFTLIELILVMALIMILSVIGIGSYTQATVKARDTQRKNDLNQISKALEAFNNDLGRYPKTDASGKMTCPGNTGEEDCGGEIYAFIEDQTSTYMEEVPTDPTNGRIYLYESSGDFGSYSYYAALDNQEDRDIVLDSDGKKTDWRPKTCGDTFCNYKITETGLKRTLEI